jgi:Carboxypeptidase regulatory-like domain
MYRSQQGYRTEDLEARAGSNCRISASASSARYASKSPNVIKRRPQLVFFAVLIALGSVPVYGAAPASVHGSTISGVVRDSSGVPQIGAEVELLRPDLTVIASVYTNTAGRFIISSVQPGRYAVKALGSSFLPSLREDVRVRTSTVVNLTLNTLYEVVEWLPSEPRSGTTQPDDWKWTLRSAANRPLLRWLEDGPLVVVSDGAGGSPKLKARLLATGQQGAFGESGERVSLGVEDTPANSRELLAQVDFDPGTDAGMESTLGFRQDLGFAGSVESLAAVAIHPEIGTGGSEGLDEAAIRSSETINLGDEWEAEAGSTQVLARFAQNSPNTILAALPFAMVGWRNGDNTVRYRMATAVPPSQASQDADDAEAARGLPRLSMRDGQLQLEHGLHQEIGWERRTDNSDVAVVVFADNINNSVMEAVERTAAGNSAAASMGAQLLFDPTSGLVRAAGPRYSTVGVVADVEHKLPRGNQVRVSYANGGALVLPAAAQPMGLAQLLASAHARRAQSCSISLSGTLDGSGTGWRATYRWQPEGTITSVASFSPDGADPYLNLQFRRPIHVNREGEGSVEALLNLRNLLAQGYQPYMLSDGSMLVFAQDQRGISGGLAFNF